ncbi:nuclear hormone receptor family member nhr-48 isoform X2 [Octopus bimaculoides]|uniref:nuclear hormone receptor family member nhr-48 isoform X2 n=1 Tax=Octopus bimaculoides TaxID=37653 RepID=UPI0022E0B200|nr:nuclear hormone receptor family member nhr-48 isoform X2 [Octopus bimaculoides]
MRMISKNMKSNDIEIVNKGNNNDSCSYNVNNNNNNNHENNNDNNNNDNNSNNMTNSNTIYLNKTQCETTRLCILQVREKILNQQHSSLNPALRARFDEEIDRLYNVAPDSFEDSNSMEPVSNHYPSVESRQLSANSAEAIKSRKNKEDKYCGVCGDRALGYNFDAISCESCKAFFRRNAPKGLDYFKCPYEEKCKMDVSNRRFCKKCRLRKCFEIGMRKEYILTEEEKMRKRQRIEENRYVRP